MTDNVTQTEARADDDHVGILIRAAEHEEITASLHRGAIADGLTDDASCAEWAEKKARTFRLVAASLAFAKEATPSASVEREPLVRLTGDDADEFSFYSDGGDGDCVITQSRYYRWGDTVIAIGEINYPNQWDDEFFEAKCATLEASLTLPVPSAPQGGE